MTQFRDRGPNTGPVEDAPGGETTSRRSGVWTPPDVTRRDATGRTAPAETASQSVRNKTAPVAKTATAVQPPPAGPDGDLGLGDLPISARWLSWRGVKRLLRFAAALVLAFFVFTFAQILAYRWIAPPTSTLMLWQKLTGTQVSRTWRPISKISPNLVRAVIMSEDAGFCGHRGVDWKELERVYEQAIDGGATGGGSTLSMQTTKNLFLWPSKSYVRKALEVPMTLVADRFWGKPRMLEIYLNIAEWGPGLFGAEAAARAYFKKSAADLTEHEAALLAVALPNPLQRNAGTPSPLQRRLAGTVQSRMQIAAKHVRCLAPG